MADTKKEYTSNLHPKGDLDTTVYPNVKSENIIDKDTTSYTAGKVPDSSLVSRSLDGLNEKIETNKIQTDTNKTNIATLQGDVSSLKSDNTQNKKDIANLKANYTEVQSQANTNSSDIALLKTNTIKKDTDASLKSLTLPSAKDLKTKDGTSFGGGSKLYNGTEYLPTFDIATLKDTYVDLSTNQTIHGIKTIIPNIKSNCGIKITQGNYYGQGEKIAIRGIGNNGSESGDLIFDNNGTYYSVALAGTNFTDTSVGVGNTIRLNSIAADIPNAIYMAVRAGAGIQINAGSNRLQFWGQNKNANHPLQLSKDYGSTFSNILTDDDIPHHYQHTVEIHYASNGSYFCFTGTSDKNTPIDSVEDLTTVFANRDLCGVGVFGSAGLSKIHVGTSVNDTTFKKYMNNGEYANPSEETFAMVFNTTGFTITDNVTAM